MNSRLQAVCSHIFRYCKRCGGTGIVARRGKPVAYKKCPRCGGRGGSRVTSQHKDN